MTCWTDLKLISSDAYSFHVQVVSWIWKLEYYKQYYNADKEKYKVSKEEDISFHIPGRDREDNMSIVWNLLMYNKGFMFFKVMFNQLTFQVKVLQGVQLTKGLNLIKRSSFCPQKSNNLYRKSNKFVNLQTL